VLAGAAGEWNLRLDEKSDAAKEPRLQGRSGVREEWLYFVHPGRPLRADWIQHGYLIAGEIEDTLKVETLGMTTTTAKMAIFPYTAKTMLCAMRLKYRGVAGVADAPTRDQAGICGRSRECLVWSGATT